jgi:predicted glycosyltransferase
MLLITVGVSAFKIWIDILTPKQAYLLGELSRRLESRGHYILRTTRRYKEVNEVLDMKGISAVTVGHHGGGSLERKLTSSARRILALTRIIDELKPDLSVAFASPEAARVSFGLRIPHFTINDSPHAKAVALLTVPLSTKLFAPKVIPIKEWIKLGASNGNIVQYNALDPLIWLKSFVPSPSVLHDLGIIKTKPILVFRLEEAFAAYLLDKASWKESVVTPMIIHLLEKYGDKIQIVALPRYKQQISVAKKLFRNRVIIPDKAIDGPSLISFSTLFVGAGGTMTAEAAMLGVPAISCFPAEPTIVEKYLIKEKLVSRITDSASALRKIIQILNNVGTIRKFSESKSKELISKMEDPIEVIIKHIEAI